MNTQSYTIKSSADRKLNATGYFTDCVWRLRFSPAHHLTGSYHFLLCSHLSSCFDRWGRSCKGIQQKYRNATFGSSSRTEQPSLFLLATKQAKHTLLLPLASATALFARKDSVGGKQVTHPPCQDQLSTQTPVNFCLRIFQASASTNMSWQEGQWLHLHTQLV